MKSRVIFIVLLFSGATLSAQQSDSDTTQQSSWRLEYQVMVGSSKVLDIEDYDQPKVGTVSQSGGFMLGLEYRLSADWALYGGIHWDARQGQAWANGIPFEIQESGLDIPVLLRVDYWDILAFLPAVDFQIGVGPYYGMVFDMSAYELPGITQPLVAGANAGFLDYHHIGLLAEIRFRIRINQHNDVSVGIYAMQDLMTFGAGDLPIVPKFNLGGVAISFSRPIF